MRFCLFLLMGLCCQIAFPQGFKVKEFLQNINDGSAFNAPLDEAGHPCGLIKVRSDNGELKFNGNIVGDVENKTNEYWVFMAQGSKTLNILHPNFLPITVDFAAFGIDEVASKATYILTLSEQKFKKEKCGLVTTVKPETASLFINDVLIENISGNGLYQLYLPKGDYVCRIEQKGFRPNVQVVTTGKGTQNLNVELESVMAEFEVKCKTGTAEIYIDGERKGNGFWKGTIFAGEHQIEARQQNYESNIQTISIAEKESQTFVIPELKRSMGKLRIQTTPNNLPVSVDGKYVGMSPCTIDIETGNHYFSCKTYGYAQYRSDFDVKSGKQTDLSVMMSIDNEIDDYDKELYIKAYNGDQEAISELAVNIAGAIYRGGIGDPLEAVFWLERYSLPEELLDFEGWIDVYCYIGNPDKALELYYPIKSKVENRGGMFLEESYMSKIGDAFLKKKDLDKAIQCYEKADKDGYEGLGDCYKAKGNKQLAASYYRKCMNLDYYDNKNRVEKKLKELGY
jgi:tetratricopeptide (TPR) repeat protein